MSMAGGQTAAASAAPKVAGMSASDTSSNEQGVPVPWWIGPDWRPLTWIISEVANHGSKENKKSSSGFLGMGGGSAVVGTWFWGDVAGIAGVGLLDRIEGIEINNEIAWEGQILRPDNPGHPAYWRAEIILFTPVPAKIRGKAVNKVYVYWGRPDQPVDDILLGTLPVPHPAYRNQVVVIGKGLYFGENVNSVPNIRVRGRRTPRPPIGNFPRQLHKQGESIVAGILELFTHPIWGAGIPTKHFTAAEWEALSADILARIGCHAPTLDRATPLLDVARNLLSYIDGWARIRNGIITPGAYPHTGAIPVPLAALTDHDFTRPLRTTTTAPASPSTKSSSHGATAKTPSPKSPPAPPPPTASRRGAPPSPSRSTCPASSTPRRQQPSPPAPPPSPPPAHSKAPSPPAAPAPPLRTAHHSPPATTPASPAPRAASTASSASPAAPIPGAARADRV